MKKLKYGVETLHKIKNGDMCGVMDDGSEIIVPIDSIRSDSFVNTNNKYKYEVGSILPTVYGVGYFGVGEHRAKNIKGKVEKCYDCWKGMLRRSYSEEYLIKQPTYRDTTVCEEWLNFQNFAEWYEKNYPKIEGIKFELDKDLLQQGIENKVYSPDTCVFLPKSVNIYLSKLKTINTSGYTGVSWQERNKKYVSRIRRFMETKPTHLGIFQKIEDAIKIRRSNELIENEKVRQYLIDLNYLPEHIIQLIK